MPEAPTPAALPPHVLERADVRNALNRRDLGEVFALARKWGGISFTKIGEAIDMKAERVGRLARGEGAITTMDKIIQAADGLRIPGHLLGLAARPWERGAVVGVVAQPPAAVALPPTGSFGLWEVAWFNPNEVGALPMVASIRKRLDDWRSGRIPVVR